MSSVYARKRREKSMAISVLAGVLGAALVCFALMLLISFLFAKSKNFCPDIVGAVMTAVCAIGAFAGGYISGKIYGKSGIICGVACGFIVFALIFIGGLTVSRESVSSATIAKFFAAVLSGTVGGIVAVNKK